MRTLVRAQHTIKNDDMRTRSKSQLAPINGTNYDTDVSCALPGRRLTQTFVAGYDGMRKVMYDEVTQRFQARSASGEIVVNPMKSFEVSMICGGNGGTARSTSYSCGTKFAYWERNGPRVAYLEGASSTDWYPPYRVCDATDTTRIIDEAVANLWAESNQSNANLFVGMAELGETLSMLRRPFGTLVKLMTKAVRKKHKKSLKAATPKEVREAVMGTWMEARYGWRPAIYEAMGVMKALEKGTEKSRFFYRSQVRKNFVKSDEVTHDFGSWTTTYTRVTTEVVTVRAGMIVEEFVSLSRRLGLDLSGLLVVPWEVVPASFVLDWVGNMGTWLQAIGAYATREPVSSWYTIEKVITTQFVVKSATPISGRLITRTPSDYMTVVLTEKDRIRHVGPPRLTIKADWAQVKSVLHTIDLGIILKQKVKF